MFRYIYHVFFSFLRQLKRYCWKRSFRHFGSKSYINHPLKIDGPSNIIINNHVFIGYRTWLAALPLTGEKECSLLIEDNCTIGNFNHIYCTKRIRLEKGVLTADKVYISDNLHDYKDIHTFIKDQPIIQKGEVVIGEGSWLGENVCVLGAKIGKHCVVGSNSVVTKDIPDYCVVVGIPAKIIKRYDFDTQTWRKTNSEGKFID